MYGAPTTSTSFALRQEGAALQLQVTHDPAVDGATPGAVYAWRAGDSLLVRALPLNDQPSRRLVGLPETFWQQMEQPTGAGHCWVWSTPEGLVSVPLVLGRDPVYAQAPPADEPGAPRRSSARP